MWGGGGGCCNRKWGSAEPQEGSGIRGIMENGKGANNRQRSPMPLTPGGREDRAIKFKLTS